MVGRQCPARNRLPAPQVWEFFFLNLRLAAQLPEARLNLVNHAQVVIELFRARVDQVSLAVGPVNPGAGIQIFKSQTSQVQPGSVNDDRKS